ncbi:lipopolysaccharide biosynthesis protein [Marinagarivorans cellulosilyticus]|uniref:Lipopolysaccharide biosynthesis protein n=1 Tax=Marinagarivorans cellulosilyticus TaxID=2721545 RepID=A0AAN1WID7_9GAMM|nr:lipopolysaccharide biosynthesis protein [Marinagarivorans cellulosilyticus]BCD98183.1 hypothetical protein MARGE09_P2384 [Marinagarivorans cellulosilyticus]
MSLANSQRATQFKKSLIFYGLSIVLMKGLSLIMLPFIAGYLPPAQMGKLELLTTAAMLLSLFVAMGLEDCLFRFAGTQTGNKQRNIVASLYGWSLYLGAVAFLLGYIAAPTISQLTGGQLAPYQLQIIWAGVALEGAISLPLGYLRMRDNAGQFFAVVIGRTFLQALLTVVLLHHNPHLDSVIIASVIATFSQAFVLGLCQYRSTGIAAKRQELTAIWRYGMPLLGSGLCMFALNGVDRIAIAQWDSLTQLGLYSVAAKFALATVLLMQPFGMWWRPRRFEWLQHRAAQCTQVLGLASVLLSLMTCGVICMAPVLIIVLMPEAYHSATLLAGAIAIMFGLREASEIHNIGLLSQQSTLPLLKINVTSAIIGASCCLLGTFYWGVSGCITGLIIAQGFRLAAIHLQGKNALVHHVQPLLLLFCVCMPVVATGISYTALSSQVGIWQLTIYSVALALGCAICAGAMVISYRLTNYLGFRQATTAPC